MRSDRNRPPRAASRRSAALAAVLALGALAATGQANVGGPASESATAGVRAAPGWLAWPWSGVSIPSGEVLAGERSATADAAVGYALADTWSSQGLSFYRHLEWPSGHEAGGIGRHPGTGQLYVTDRTGSVIRVFGSDGTPIGTLGGPGSAPGMLSSPRDVDALSDGRLVVSDTGNSRVQVLGADGSPLAAWPVAGPQGIEVVRDGIYVVERAELRVKLFGADGALLRDLDLSRRLVEPEGIAYREDVPGSDPPAARLDVGDRGLGRLMTISELSTGATPALTFPGIRAGARLPGAPSAGSHFLIGAGPPRDAAVGEVGALAMADDRERVLSRVPFGDVTDVEVASARLAYAAASSDGLIVIDDLGLLLNRDIYTFGRLIQPRRIAVGDRAVLADAATRVQIWSRAGVPEQDVPLRDLGAPPPGGTPVPPGPALPIADQVPPLDVATGGASMFALWESGAIRRLEGGAWVAEIAGEGVGSWRTAISARDGIVAVLDVVDQAVRFFDDDLNEVGGFSIDRGAGFEGVLDIALSDGHVFLIDRQAGQLEVWSRDGELRSVADGVAGPLRVAAGPDGNAFVLTQAGWVLSWSPGTGPGPGPGLELRGAWSVGSSADAPVDLDLDAEGRLYVADAHDRVRVYEPRSGSPGELPSVPVGGCGLLANKGVVPDSIDLGETVEVQLVLQGNCPVTPPAVDIVMAIDRSGSMLGSKMLAAKDASVGFVLRSGAGSRFGIVPFSNSADRAQELTADRRAAIAAIGGMAPAGGTNLVDALRTARTVMADGPPRAGGPAARVIVLISDGRHTSTLDPERLLDSEIRSTHGAGIEVFAVGLGEDAQEATLIRIASSPDHYFHSPTEDALDDIFSRIAGRIGSTLLFEVVEIEDTLPANMQFVPGSGAPVEPDFDAATRTLSWRLTPVEAPGIRLTYRVRPLEGGLHPTNVQALASFTDGLGAMGEVVFPVPRVNVAAPTPSATATGLATATATPSATATVSPSPPIPPPTRTPDLRPPLATPTPSATPRGPTTVAFIPFAARQRCEPTVRGVDVMLLLDSSTSMAGPTREGGATKIDAAVGAALGFLDLLDPAADRAAVATFDDSSRLLEGLSSDARALRLALLDVRLSPGTRIDAGLELAEAVLLGPGGRPGVRPVLILMTDGQPTRSGVSRTVLLAERLKSAGVTLFAIGLGADVDGSLLALLATTPGHYFEAPNAEDLSAVYRSIAETLPCR